MLVKPDHTETARVAEETARASYGKLVAQLTAVSGDIAAAEDALSDAFAAALKAWPDKGIPETPEAWLMTTAKRNLIDGARRASTHKASTPTLTLLSEEQTMTHEAPLMDRRLELLFLCAHPAIDPAIHTPLMLQSVLGLKAEQIASTFLTKPASMAQRLVRAKRKIKAAKIPFLLPPKSDWPDRLSAVLQAVYAAYNAGWDDTESGADTMTGLAREAEWLARLIIDLSPDDPEPKGLLALILFCESRRAARTQHRMYVPLKDQDTALWSAEMIEEANTLLADAAKARTPGRFQLEAAIQSVHAARRLTTTTDWLAIVTLYNALIHVAPSWGAKVARIAAISEAHGPSTALGALQELPETTLATYGPYWATKAHILQQLGDIEDARTAYQKAANLTNDQASREYLLNQIIETKH